MDTKDLILVALGIGLQLLSRIPKFDLWYNGPALDGWRGWIMAGFSLVVVAIMFGLSCTPLFQFVPCSEASGMQLLKDWIVLFAGNQLSYLTFAPSAATKVRKGI